MSMYLDKVEESLEQINNIIEELEVTYGGEKYVSRLKEIANEMQAELGVEENE